MRIQGIFLYGQCLVSESVASLSDLLCFLPCIAPLKNPMKTYSSIVPLIREQYLHHSMLTDKTRFLYSFL